MLTIRPAAARGTAQFDWLESYHSFSFGHYYDPVHMGFSVLRVINEDRIAPGKGFGMHSHRDMEIITYMLAGALEHKDSLGNGSIIQRGDVQRMSAGTGILHSEFNPSSAEASHLLQIWILPNRTGLPPSYEERHFEASGKQGQWQLIAAPTGGDRALTIHQDVMLFATLLEPQQSLPYTFGSDRRGWLQVAAGTVRVNGVELNTGDGLAIAEEAQLLTEGITAAEVLLFDLPATPTPQP
ncbi:pirin family protein [Thermosynechococcaceae cyanobacterium Okahandja]